MSTGRRCTTPAMEKRENVLCDKWQVIQTLLEEYFLICLLFCSLPPAMIGRPYRRCYTPTTRRHSLPSYFPISGNTSQLSYACDFDFPARTLPWVGIAQCQSPARFLSCVVYRTSAPLFCLPTHLQVNTTVPVYYRSGSD